ncbi:pyocin activator PrtN family protein [Agarivorans sp. MS3-6]
MTERNTRVNNNLFSTKAMLAGMFGMKPCVPLQEVTQEFLDMSFNTAQRKARLNELPFPAFRLGKTQKAPWFVCLNALAEYVEEQSKYAKQQWRRSNS